ncbi:hypothetical protein BJY16_005479 [Actinoplanes octamycinicus]|uniref:von Hippel-Lindau disease tumour suppressor beta domain-containing protein n=1 Tax=Actinoplanes octamycinicus TaxID=135948 RepID=A0A7W7M9P2_9ACTN|nr:hypothetical protein [Actinoplanes octamycinicus]MBB4742020.1 hypothetical protein [Actinoplanes octamycinicus]GIE60783.1 hypothetical protein Aoc01nite_61850 [Actinoplanes octamycinicus]
MSGRPRPLSRRRRRLIVAGVLGASSALAAAVLLLQPRIQLVTSFAGVTLPPATHPGRLPTYSFAPSPAAPASGTATRQRQSPPHRTSTTSPPASTGPVPVQVTVLSARSEGRVRSLDDERSTEIQFVNDRDEPVVIYWLDYRGTRERYAVLGSGKTRQQPTFVSHPWVITDLTGRALTIFLPASRPARATIT